MKRKLIPLLSCAAVLVGGLATMGIASAQTTLDPPLFIGNPTTCPQGNCSTTVLPGEVNPLGNTSLTIFDQGGPSVTLANPVLLILGFVNSSAPATLPGITLSSGTGSAGGSLVYGGSWNTSTGFHTGAFSSSSLANDVYEFLGLPGQGGGSDSESFVNWTAAEAAIGIAATSFTIGVYELINTGLHNGSGIEVDFNTDLAKGTVAVAFGCDPAGVTANGCSPGGNVYATPFTNAGLVTSSSGGGGASTGGNIPEPATVALLGLGMLGMGISRKPRSS